MNIMRLRKIIFCANLFSCAAIYSVHNFMKSLYKENLKQNYRDLSLLEIFTIMRMFSAYMISNIADRTYTHALISLICITGYVSTISVITLFSQVFKISGFGYKLVIVDLLIKIFDSGFFPTMEILILNSSVSRSGGNIYSYMRLSLVFGRTLAHLSNIIATEGFLPLPGFFKNKEMIAVSIFYLALATPFLITTCLKGKREILFPSKDEDSSDEAVEERKKKTDVPFFKSLKRIVVSEYGLVLFFVACQGVHRISMANFQPDHIKKYLISKTMIRLIFLFRVLPELVIEASAPYVERRIGLLCLTLLGALSGLFKLMMYANVDKKISKEWKLAFYICLEPFKAMFSTYISYGCTRLTKHYNPSELLTSAQGIYNGMYNAVGACASGILGYIYIVDNKGTISFDNFFNSAGFFGAMGLIPLFYLIFWEKKGLFRK